MIAQRLGPYRIERDLARGGLGAVKLARHETTGDRVALKLPQQGSEDYCELLRREAELLTRLTRAGHSSIVRALASGVEGGVPWYAMEFVDGPDLRTFTETLWQGARAEARAGHRRPCAAAGRLQEMVRLLAGIADALACAHALGVVHCDLKPSNVILRGGSEPVLVDFGSSLLARAGSDARESLQVEGAQRGTVGYMAPEQLVSGEVDARCDLYALGNIAYELLAGRAPFVAASALGLAEQHLTERPPAPSRWVADLPPELDALVLHLLEKEPRRRATFASEVAGLLWAWLRPARGMHVARVVTPLFRPKATGRGDVLERLMANVERTIGGEGSLVILSGESGVGKTHATRELLRRMRGLPATVVCGAAGEAAAQSGAGASVALEPFLGCLRLLARRCAHESELARRLALELAVLAPYDAALAALPDLPYGDAPALPGPLALRRVLKCLRDVLLALAEPEPLVLVLDDLHAADELSLAFLSSEHVAALTRARVLIVGTRRAEQTNTLLRDALARQRHEEIVLERLALPGVRAMVSDMLGDGEPPPEFVNALFRNSGGNPLYVAAFLQSALDSGALARDEGRWRFPEPSSTLGAALLGNAGPAPLHDIARLRLAALSDAEAELLALASLLGHEFEPGLLPALLAVAGGAGEPAVAVTLDRLVARELLEVLANGHYRFTHAVLREAAGEKVPAERAAELHGVAAQAKSAAAADDANLRVAYELQIGVHWALGGRPDNALDHLERAARRAEATHAYRLAIDVNTLAVEQYTRLHTSEWPERALDTSELLADLHARAAAYVAARRQYAFTIERAAAPLRVARLWRKYAESHWKVHEYAEALQALERASGQLAASEAAARGSGGDVAAAALAATARENIALQQARFSIHYFMNPHGEETQQLLREMSPRVEAYGTPQQKSYFFQCLANEAVGRNRYRYSADAVAAERRALAVLESEAEGVIERALAEFDLGFMLLLGEQAECREAVGRLSNAALSAERYEDMTLLARALTYQSIGHRRLRELEPARSTATRAQHVAERAQVQPYVGVAHANLAWVAWYEGNEERARSLLAECRRCWAGPHIFPFQWLATFVTLDIQAAEGDLAGAKESLLALVEPRQQQLPRSLDESLQRACTMLNEADAARAHRELMATLGVARDLGYL